MGDHYRTTLSTYFNSNLRNSTVGFTIWRPTVLPMTQREWVISSRTFLQKVGLGTWAVFGYHMPFILDRCWLISTRRNWLLALGLCVLVCRFSLFAWFGDKTTQNEWILDRYQDMFITRFMHTATEIYYQFSTRLQICSDNCRLMSFKLCVHPLLLLLLPSVVKQNLLPSLLKWEYIFWIYPWLWTMNILKHPKSFLLSSKILYLCCSAATDLPVPGWHRSVRR